MRSKVSMFVAGWLVLWGLNECAVLGQMLFHVVSSYRRWRVDLGFAMLKHLFGTLCLWEGILFFRRRIFSLFGVLTLLANILHCAWFVVRFRQQISISQTLGPEFLSMARAVLRMSLTVGSLHLFSLGWIFLCRHRAQTGGSA